MGEAHFGEDALTRLNVAAGPGLARDSPTSSRRLPVSLVHYRAEGTLLVAADASDRAADRRRTPVPAALGLRRPAPDLDRSAAPPSPSWLPVSGRGGAGRRPPGGQPSGRRRPPRRLPHRCPSPSSRTRLPRSRPTPTGVTGVTLRWRRASRHRLGGAGRRLPIGPGGRCARSPPAPGSTGQGAHPPAPRPGRGAPSPAHRPGTGARSELLSGAAARRHGGGGGHRRGEGIRPDRAGRVRGRAARRRPTAGPGHRRVRAASRPPPDCGPGSPDNAPIVGPTGLPGLVVATGHYRNGILLAPTTADEVVGVLEDRGRRRGVPRLRPRPVRPGRRACMDGPRSLRCRRPMTAIEVNGQPLGGPARDHGDRAGLGLVPLAQGHRRGPQRRGGPQEHVGRHPCCRPATGSRSSPRLPAADRSRRRRPSGPGRYRGPWSTSPPTLGPPGSRPPVARPATWSTTGLTTPPTS